MSRLRLSGDSIRSTLASTLTSMKLTELVTILLELAAPVRNIAS
ncbi:MAG: hypothetical protein OEV51_02340 [Nitrospira sp.]|nr:hypothetical protein [Nitrospira sp.]